MKRKNIIWEKDFKKILRGEITIKNKNNSLRRWLLKKNYLEYKCYSCGIKEWKGEKITLDLDHIDGDRSNNKLENLRFLCPNCHSQTKTYRGKNIKSSNLPIKSHTKDIIRLYTQGSNINQILYKLGFSGGKNYKIIENILKENKVSLKPTLLTQVRINKIKSSNIDFSKKTWGVELSDILGLSPQYCLQFVKKYLPEVLEVKKEINLTREEINENRIKLFKESNLDPNDKNFYTKLGNLYGISKWASKRFYKKYLK